jgi:HD-like signal output (HDOD) protein
MAARKLVVLAESQPDVLRATKRSLKHVRRDWDVTFAHDSNAALTALAAGHVDALVVDDRLADLPAELLLEQARVQSPSTIRILRAAGIDPAPVARASPVVHRMLPKLSPISELAASIEAALAANDRLPEEKLKRLLGRASKLPVVPALYSELCAALQRADCHARTIAEIVSRDLAVSARVMQLASSAYFGIAASSLEAAVVLLGVEIIKAICLVTGVFALADDDPSLPRPLRAAELSTAAVESVRLVRAMIGPERGEHREQAAVAALLRDLGTLVLTDRARDDMSSAARQALSEQRPRAEVERERFGADHAEAGAYLLELWGLPAPVVAAVRKHRRVVNAPTDGVSAVALAAQLSDFARGIPSELAPATVDPKWLRLAQRAP